MGDEQAGTPTLTESGVSGDYGPGQYAHLPKYRRYFMDVVAALEQVNIPNDAVLMGVTTAIRVAAEKNDDGSYMHPPRTRLRAAEVIRKFKELELKTKVSLAQIEAADARQGDGNTAVNVQVNVGMTTQQTDRIAEMKAKLAKRRKIDKE